MCSLCDKIYTEKQLQDWIDDWHHIDGDNIIIGKKINYYLYIAIDDAYYTPQTATLINYCPVCGKKL